MSEEERALRNYNVRESTQEWIAEKAKTESRSTIKQVEVILEAARKKDQEDERTI